MFSFKGGREHPKARNAAQGRAGGRVAGAVARRVRQRPAAAVGQ
jgi:hypothetical protein